MSANHAALASAASASVCSADSFSMITCHASLLHNGQPEVFLEPLSGLVPAHSVRHPYLGRAAAAAGYPVSWALEYDVDVHAEDADVRVILLLGEVCVVRNSER